MRSTVKLAALLLVVAACRGAQKSPATTDEGPPATGSSSGGRVAAPGSILGDAALYAEVEASTIPLPAGDGDLRCEGAATLGALVAKWRAETAGTVSASCDGTACRVELSTPRDPSCDSAVDEGCDGSGYVIELTRDAAGAIVPASLQCVPVG